MIAFFSPLLGETNLLSIGGIKVPALMSIILFITAVILSKKKELSFLFTNKVFIAALFYFLIIFLNYAFVLKDLFFKVYEELTPLWISIFRRLITVLFIYLTFKDEKQAIRLFYFYCAGLVFSSFSAYPEMFLFKHSLFDASISEGNEGYQRAIGFFANPNDFALVTVIAAIFVYHHYILTKKKKFLLITFLLIPPVFLSFSRNGLACLFLATFLTFNIDKKIKLSTVLYLFFSFIALSSIVYFVPSIRERVLLLFSGEDSSAVGRLLIMYTAFESWLTKPFLGIGVYSAPLLMEEFGNAGLLITIHNFYAHALFETGIIGFVVVIYFLYVLYKSTKTIFHVQNVSLPVSVYAKSSLIALIVTYFYIFSGNHIIFEYFWYMIGVQLVILRSLSKKGVFTVNKNVHGQTLSKCDNVSL